MSTRTVKGGVRPASLNLSLSPSTSPAPLRTLLVASLALIVVLGTAIASLRGSHLYNVALSAVDQGYIIASSSSSPPATIFADRRNLLNRIVVKRAWAWVTLVWLAQALTLRSAGEGASGKKSKDDQPTVEDQEAIISSPLARSFLRYAAATALWGDLFAAWFFGPPLMSRVALWTGAKCVPIPTSVAQGASLDAVDPLYCLTNRPIRAKDRPDFFGAEGTEWLLATKDGSVAAPGVNEPKALRARFRGGHDTSGHTYILVLSSLFLSEELLPFVPYLLPVSVRLSRTFLTLLPRSAWARSDPFGGPRGLVNSAVMVFGLSLIAVFAFCLVNTALYFHTPAEKISGLLAGLGAGFLLPKGG